MPTKASKGNASAPPKNAAARERPQPAAHGKKKPTASLRKPSAPKSVDDFVTAGGESSAGSTPREGGPKNRTLVARKDGTERRRTTVYFAPELAKRLNVYCATHDLEMSQVVGEAVERLLTKKGM
jgi:hypothetical protein